MRSVDTLANGLGQDYGMKFRQISSAHGQTVGFEIHGETMNDLHVCLTIDDNENLDYQLILHPENIGRIAHLKFDDINAMLVKKYLDTENIEYMHIINDDDAQHSFIPA